MRLLGRLRNWVNNYLHPARGYKLLEVQELDRNKLKNQELLLDIRGGKARWLHLKCPDGCGDIISLNLMKSVKPYWKIEVNNQIVTIYPSVWKKSGCRSHFFIRDSKIDWV